MSPVVDVPREVDLAGRAIGLLDDDGNVDAGWFQGPDARLRAILSDAAQRAALLGLLRELLPPETPAGVPAGEQWHPLLGAGLSGNVFLIVGSVDGQVTFGIGALVHSTTATPQTSLRLRLPIVRCDGDHIRPIAGTAAGPLQLDLRVELNWRRNPQAIGLRAVRVSGSLAPIGPDAGTNLVVVLEQLDLDGSGARDTVLDATRLDSQALDVVFGFIREELRQLAGGAAGETARVVAHLGALLGLDGNVPRLPFDRLAQDPLALSDWFRQQVDSGRIVDWLTALGGLLGANAPAAGSGTAEDPWRVPTLALNGNSTLEVILARRDPARLDVGVRAAVAPDGASPRVRVEARAMVASIPLAGTASAAVLPAADVVIRAPGSAGPLVASAAITVDALRAGLRWDGSTLAPVLELEDVTLAGAQYARIDLTNTDSVEAAASGAVSAALRNALGATGAGARLAALAGLIAPAGAPSWGHTLNPADLVTSPTRAIARLHREVLLHPIENWSFLLGELASLLGLGGAVVGSGRRTDPWRVPLAPGALTIELAAWNDQSSGAAADPQFLRLGLRAFASLGPMTFWWLAEILAVDLPADGNGDVRLMAGQHAAFGLQPVPAAQGAAGLSMSADSIGLTMDWPPAGSMALRGEVRNLSVTAGGATTTIPSIAFPAPAGLDVTSPAALGLPVATLEILFRQLLAHGLIAWNGRAGALLASLLGLHRALDALPADWPLLQDPGAPGSLFSDPAAAARDWVARVATGISSDGQPYLTRALSALRALIANAVPSLDRDFRGDELRVEGSGRYDDPWSLSLGEENSRPLELLAWLEPDGPPPAWAAGLPSLVNNAADVDRLAEAASELAKYSPPLRDAFAAVGPSRISDALIALDRYLAQGDGVVPLASQVPSGATWTAGAALECAHHRQPTHASAIAQILAQVNTWQPSAPRAVLLLGPAFADRSAWSALLAAAEAATPGSTSAGAHFNLRQPGVDPLSVDLSIVTAAADFYTAHLADNGTGDLVTLVAQIARLVDRVVELRGIVPILVAHSTAGVAARAYTAANPARVRGLITLGTPHAGASLLPIRTPIAAQALRWIRGAALVLPPGAVSDAIDHLVEAVDGYRPPATAGDLPQPMPYPVGSFGGTATTDTGGVPALALASTLGGTLGDALRQSLGTVAAAAATPGSTTPTHLAFGVRVPLGFPPSGSDLAAYATLRADIFRIALARDVPEPARPAQRLVAQIILERPGGWLVGAAQAHAAIGAPPDDVRLRRAEMGAAIEASAGRLVITPRVRLIDGAFHGPLEPIVEIGQPLFAPLVGAAFQRLSNPPPPAGSGLDLLLDSLQALGIAVPDPHGGVGVSAEALTAIALDAAGFLAPRVATALDLPGGLGAFAGPAGGPWTLAIGELPLEAYITAGAAPSIGLRTRAGSVLPLAGGSLDLDARVALPAFGTTLTCTARLGAATLSYSTSRGTLTIALPPWLDTFTLVPAPPSAAFVNAFNVLVPRLMLSSAVAAFFQTMIGPELNVGPIDAFLAAPAATTRGSGALGNGGFLDATKINQLLEAIGRASGAPAGPGLQLPGGLRLSVSGTDPLTLRLETLAAIGGVASCQLDANIDSAFHVTAAGQLSLHVVLTGTWPSVDVVFGVTPAGVSLIVQPQGLAPIRLLPTFSGFESLALAGAALLPRALDEVVGAFGSPPPALVDLTLDVAEALDLYDRTGGFAAHTPQLRAMVSGTWWAGFPAARQAQVASAIATLFNDAASPLRGQLPGTFSTAGSAVIWTFDVPGVPGAHLSVQVGWDESGPTLTIRSTGLRPSDAPLALDFGGGYASGHIAAEAAVSVRMPTELGVGVTPRVEARLTGGGFTVGVLPLGAGTDGVLRIDLAPAAGVRVGSTAVPELARQWLLPLARRAILSAAGLDLTRTLWAGGPNIQQLLEAARIVGPGSTPLPPVEEMIAGLMVKLAEGAPSIPVTPSLTLKFASDGGRLGARLTGAVEIPADSLVVRVLFGDPPSAVPDADRGVTIYLFSTSGASLQIDPQLHVIGLGVELSGREGAPLVNTAVFRLGGFAGLLFFDVRFLDALRQPDLALDGFGAGLVLDRFGIPLGRALNQNMGGDNPVAASLLRSDTGSAAGSGDANPVNPEVDVFVSYRGGAFAVRFSNTTAIWIPVQRSFGPIYIDQLGVVLIADTSVALLIDGSVKVAALTVQADDLGVTIPFRSLLSPADWRLELRGLAVSFQQGGVSIAGGLVKDPGPPVQYVGMLLVNVAGRGITAVGAYARPAGADSYTSFFAFAVLGYPLGGPPYFFVLGLGGGLGYNRRLLVPADTGQVGTFMLVSAIDNTGFANDPMGALRAMLTSVPPSRGSLWLAAGVKFTSFALIEGVAVIYVALDRGFEIGLLGLARMALPRPEFPIAMVELALRARFSTAEMLLSVQAQLTDNSFLFDRSCRLTGGYAFCIWFRTGEFVLTLGGYHPSFTKPPHFPVVPRLGFHWSVSDNIAIKGEAYFALTLTCVMAGGRLEAAARFGSIRAWFTATADFLVAWDPFYYVADIGISVGVEARIRVCFFVCGTVHIKVSVGARLHLEGPPLHGSVTVEYRVISVTIPFGHEPRKQNFITWNAFKQKYLISGDPDGTCVGIQIVDGLVAPEPPGSSPAPGTAQQPWQLRAEFVFNTETRMPADSLLDSTGATVPVGVERVDLAPVGARDALSTHWFQIVRRSDNAVIPLDANHWSVTTTIGPFPEATWRLYDPKAVPAASRNIDAISGLAIRADAFLHGQSALIRIKGMVDDDASHALPLPFTTVDNQTVARLVESGAAADALMASLPQVTTAGVVRGAETVLSGPAFAQIRSASNLRARGLAPVAVAALRGARSAPPRIEPLSTGLTMRSVDVPDTPPIVKIDPEPAVPLDRLRLRAVLQTSVRPAVVAPAPLRTTVSRAAAGAMARTIPPSPRIVPGARLTVVAERGAPRPTVASVGARTLRNGELGYWTSRRQQDAIDRASSDVLEPGVRVPAGAMHVWDLPDAPARVITVSGVVAVRTIFMDAQGAPVDDVEFVVNGERTIDVPANTARVAIACLGAAAENTAAVEPAFGAVSLQAAPFGGQAATGWQSGIHLQQLSSSLYAARGAQVLTNRMLGAAHKGQVSDIGVVAAGDALAEVQVIETRVPIASGVVAVLVDRADASAADEGDFTIGAAGASLATPPVALGSGSRRVLLYDVINREPAARLLAVTVGSRAGWRVTGVAGLSGRASEWAARFSGAVPEQIVPDGPLTTAGTATVRFRIGPRP